MLNKITIIGNVGKNPEIRTTKTGKEIANFSVATSKSWKDQDGQKQTKTSWHRVSVFGGLVNIVKSYVKAGTKLYLEGEMEYGEYEKDGHKNYTATIILSGFNSNLILLGSKEDKPQMSQQDSNALDNLEDEIPF